MQVPIGNNQASINTTGINWIIDPRKEIDRTIVASENKTAQEVFFLERPSKLNIEFASVNSNLDSNISGNISLTHASYLNKPSDFTLNLSNYPSTEKVTLSNIWPFPKEHINKYTFSMNIQNYLVYGDGIWDKSTNKKWEGYFDSPGETKNLILYLYKNEIPNPNTPIVDSTWLNGSSGTITQDNYSKIKTYEDTINEKDYLVIQEAIFQRDQQNHINWPISLNGKEGIFVASKFFFFGDSLDISNKSTLDMTSNVFSFKQITLSKNDSTIKLHTLSFGEPQVEDHYTMKHGGNTILVPKDTPVSIEGNTINPILLQGNSNDFLNSKYSTMEYGVLEVKNGVYNDGYLVLEPGAYYFPNGFDFSESVDKTPQNGGLIKIAGYNTN